jgi:hypothetical protein
MKPDKAGVQMFDARVAAERQASGDSEGRPASEAR